MSKENFTKEKFLQDLVKSRNEDLKEKYGLTEEQFLEEKRQAIIKSSEQTLLEILQVPHQKLSKGKDGNVLLKGGEIVMENDITVMEIKKEIATYMLDRVGRKEYAAKQPDNPTENFDGFTWGEPLPPQTHNTPII
jgi:hypothetical protein